MNWQTLKSRKELALPAGAAVVVLAFALANGPGAIGLVAGGIVGLASAALLFGLINLVGRLRGRPPGGLPGLDRWVAPGWQWKVIGGLAVVFFGLREGALAPDFVLKFNAYSMTHQTNVRVSGSGSGTTFGGAAPVSFRGRAIECSFPSCTGRPAVCEAFEQALPCTGASAERETSRTARLTLNVQIQSGGTCWMPLQKSAKFRAQVFGSLSAHRTRMRNREDGRRAPATSASKRRTVHGSVTVQQTASGPMSCRLFRRKAGFKLAREVYGAALSQAGVRR